MLYIEVYERTSDGSLIHAVDADGNHLHWGTYYSLETAMEVIKSTGDERDLVMIPVVRWKEVEE